MRVRFSIRAQSELRAAVAYLAERNPLAAKRLRRRIEEAAQTLARFPERNRASRPGGRRQLVVRPYILIYVVQDETVMITRVLHGACDLDCELGSSIDDET